MLSCLYLHLSFCFNPHLRPAGKRFVWAIHYLTRAVYLYLVALAILFVSLDRKYWQISALGIGSDVVLINVDASFHLVFTPLKRRSVCTYVPISRVS